MKIKFWQKLQEKFSQPEVAKQKNNDQAGQQELSFFKRGVHLVFFVLFPITTTTVTSVFRYFFKKRHKKESKEKK